MKVSFNKLVVGVNFYIGNVQYLKTRGFTLDGVYQSVKFDDCGMVIGEEEETQSYNAIMYHEKGFSICTIPNYAKVFVTCGNELILTEEQICIFTLDVMSKKVGLFLQKTIVKK